MYGFSTVEPPMATNLALDQELLDRAFRVSGEPTKKAAITRALQAFIARREKRQVAELLGKLEWDASCDDKAERARQFTTDQDFHSAAKHVAFSLWGAS